MGTLPDDPIELERLGHARIAEGHAMLARAAELRSRKAEAEWLPVAESPLGRRPTLRLARKGLIASAKIGRRVFVEARSLRAFIEGHRRVAVEDEDLFGPTSPPRPARRSRRRERHRDVG